MSDTIIEDREVEILTILMEECGEVIQECSKILRFGNDYSKLEKELADVGAMVALLHDDDRVSYTEMDMYEQQKFEKLKKYSNLEI
jgi:NTP pyrophosphatase (non-canonical NTP hydrolase)